MIYIQSDSERKLPHHFDAACAMYGAIETGKEFRLTSFEDVKSGKLNLLIKNNLFVGSTEFMKEVFKNVFLDDIRLPANSNRDYKIIALGEALDMVKTGKKIFIKPLEIKLFTGFVLGQMQYESINNLPLETLIMVYEPFPYRLMSEWRIYVHNHKMVDSRNYSGDYTKSPNYEYVNHFIEYNKLADVEFPCAYTIDIGILENNQNVVVEYNDMWAIGNYGIPNDIYLRLLKDRYFQIMKK